jgi:hypothetical protein
MESQERRVGFESCQSVEEGEIILGSREKGYQVFDLQFVGTRCGNFSDFLDVFDISVENSVKDLGEVVLTSGWGLCKVLNILIKKLCVLLLGLVWDTSGLLGCQG